MVNGLLAIILVAWLADSPTRHPIPAPDQAAKLSPDRPIRTLASIDLPPPPPARHQDSGTHPVSPMRPPIKRTGGRASERTNEIVALRAAEARPRSARPLVPTPLKPTARPEPNPGPVSDPGVSSANAEIRVDAEAVRDGRQLLRILEHGDGPGIEIAWPGSGAERERLHGVLRRCFGMRLALIDRSGGLYLDAGPRGTRWPIDLDRFSGFVRRPNGRITPAEQRDAGRVERYHRRLPATDPVRLFPRVVDAALLGGLADLLGDGYRSSKAITASYRLRGQRLTVEGVRMDGRRVTGRIDLSRVAACRGAGRS